jgi:hypothetical protein
VSTDFRIRHEFRARPGEVIQHSIDSIPFISGKALPSYRVFFPIPPLMRAGLLVSEQRMILVAYMFGFLVQESSFWYRATAPADDPEIIQSVALGEHKLLGKYLEVVSHHPRRMKYLNWLAAPTAVMRFYTGEAGRLLTTMEPLVKG